MMYAMGGSGGTGTNSGNYFAKYVIKRKIPTYNMPFNSFQTLT
jgi:hypothetical protein